MVPTGTECAPPAPIARNDVGYELPCVDEWVTTDLFNETLGFFDFKLQFETSAMSVDWARLAVQQAIAAALAGACVAFLHQGERGFLVWAALFLSGTVVLTCGGYWLVMRFCFDIRLSVPLSPSGLCSSWSKSMNGCPGKEHVAKSWPGACQARAMERFLAVNTPTLRHEFRVSMLRSAACTLDRLDSIARLRSVLIALMEFAILASFVCLSVSTVFHIMRY